LIRYYRPGPCRYQPLRFLRAYSICRQFAADGEVGATALGVVRVCRDKMDAPLIQHPFGPV